MLGFLCFQEDQQGSLGRKGLTPQKLPEIHFKLFTRVDIDYHQETTHQEVCAAYEIANLISCLKIY